VIVIIYSIIVSLKGTDMASSKKYSSVALLGAVLGGLVLCAGAHAVEFAGGTGEPNDPYQIATAEQLLAVGGVDSDGKHYLLTASIDLGGATRSDSVIGWFAGTFDGNGHVIRNLHLRGDFVGVFGVIHHGAEVRNLGVEDIQMTDAAVAGVLASWNWGRIINCHSTGSIVSDGAEMGGLVASNFGTVANCYSTVTVTGTWPVGGLAGNNGGTISSCYATGDVTGRIMGGGLVGENWGTVSSCYATGDVKGMDLLGGLVGHGPGRIFTSYCVGAVVASDPLGHGSVGGLAGEGFPTLNPSVCYFLAPSDGGGPDNGIGTALTRDQMQQQASFVGWDFWPSPADTVSHIWFMPAQSYPVLAWQTDIAGLQTVPDVRKLSLDEAKTALTAAGFVVGDIRYDFDQALPSDHVIYAAPYPAAPAGATIDLFASLGGAYDWAGNPGQGTAADPYQIQTAGQLESLADHPELWDKHFVLTADADMTGRTYAAALIAPDTDNTVSGFQGTPFTGSLDGQGHAIRNLTIHCESHHDYLGLFGMIGPGANISNLHLLDVDIAGGPRPNIYIGALAGHNAGTVADCYATGSLTAGRGDGMVGFNAGSLINCQAEIVWR
jgi:hypothetical protein